MKLTDYALIFLAVIIPVIIIVFVQISYVVKAEQQEMYYRGIVSTALTDATVTMKQVENADVEVDYGYSGIVDNKVSINAEIGINTFFSTMYNNMGIGDNKSAQYSFNKYVPVVAVIDYDGIYIRSAEETTNEIKYITKPKRYFSYKYTIQRNTATGDYEMVQLDSIANLSHNAIVYDITFTQDDYVYLDVYKYKMGDGLKLLEDSLVFSDEIENYRTTYTKGFYLNDENNNTWLVGTTMISRIPSDQITTLKSTIITKLEELRKPVIATICMQEVSSALNKYNQLASALGIKYTYKFDVGDNEWYDAVGGIGIVAIVQGINLGNRYLNYTAYSNSDLQLTKRYYFSDTFNNSNFTKYKVASTRYYHNSIECPLYKAYKEYIDSVGSLGIIPQYTYDKSAAAKSGFHVCPICKP